MKNRFCQVTLLVLALIFSISTNVVVASTNELMQPDIAVQQDVNVIPEKFVDQEASSLNSQDQVLNGDTDKEKLQSRGQEADQNLDIAAIKNEIDHHLSTHIDIAKKIHPESYGKKGFDRKKVIKKISDVIKAEDSEYKGKFDALAAVIKEDRDVIALLSSVDASDKCDNVNLAIEACIERWNSWPRGSLIKAIQIAAINKYGLFNSSLDQWKGTDLGRYEAHLETLGLIIGGMKRLTEDTFRGEGVTHLTLYRGLTLSEKMEQRERYAHRLSALSSFTLSGTTARNFSYPTPGLNGYILVKRFPVERICCFWGTGLGTFFEFEAIVLGPQHELDEFYVIRSRHESYDEEQSYNPPKTTKKANINKWVDYGRQKACNKKALEKLQPVVQKGNEAKEDLTPSMSQKNEYSSKRGVITFFIDVFSAILTLIKDVVCQLVQAVKDLFV